MKSKKKAKKKAKVFKIISKKKGGVLFDDMTFLNVPEGNYRTHYTKNNKVKKVKKEIEIWFNIICDDPNEEYSGNIFIPDYPRTLGNNIYKSLTKKLNLYRSDGSSQIQQILWHGTNYNAVTINENNSDFNNNFNNIQEGARLDIIIHPKKFGFLEVIDAIVNLNRRQNGEFRIQKWELLRNFADGEKEIYEREVINSNIGTFEERDENWDTIRNNFINNHDNDNYEGIEDGGLFGKIIFDPIDPSKVNTSINWRDLSIFKLPDIIGDLTINGNLDLSLNYFRVLPDGFSNIEIKGTLDLYNVHLTELPENFGNIKIDGNLLILPNTIKSLPRNFGKYIKGIVRGVEHIRRHPANWFRLRKGF